MAINSLSYVGVYSDNIAQWLSYGTNVLGLEDNSSALALGNENLYLKMDDRPFRFVIEPSSENRFGFCGWECHSEKELENTLRDLEVAGIEVTQASPQQCAERCVHRLYSFSDPAGNRHELSWGVISDFKRLVSPVGVREFITGKLGMGHVVLPAPNFDETSQFFIDVLGFALSDFMEMRFTDDPAEPAKRLWFMHCNPRHHSLGLFEVPHPAGCIHCMVEVNSIDEVGRCDDRRIEHGVKLTATLGRHANDQMVSFYMQTPSGFDMEYGAEGMQVEDWSSYNCFESTVPSYWGHDFSVGQADS